MLKKYFNSDFIYYIPVWIFLSLLGNAATFYLLELAKPDTFFTTVIFKIIVAVVVSILLFWTCIDWSRLSDTKTLIKRISYSYLFSYLLGLSYVLGYQMTMNGMTDLGVKGKIFIALVSGGMGISLLPLSNLWFRFMDYVKKNRSKSVSEFPAKTSVKLFFISMAVIFVCWLPAFLAYYPAIMSYDFHRQSQEATLGWNYFNTHHPLIHTALIRFTFLLSEKIGSYQIGMAIFSIIQMLILSASFAYSCTMIGRLTGKKWPVWTTTGLFALLPIHPVLALSVTKDILFTAFVVLMVTLMPELRFSKTAKKRVFLYIALAVVGILAIMFRNNAIHAFLIFAVFYVIFSNKQRIAVLILCITILLGGSLAKTGLQNAMEAGSGSAVEMYSIFLQQMCRVGAYHNGYLTLDQEELLLTYVAEEAWYNYNPSISDGLKASVTVYTFSNWENDIPGMLKDWIKLGLDYPNDYIDAFLAMTQGYWFLNDRTHSELLGYGVDSDMGLLYTFNAPPSEIFAGVETHSFLPGLRTLYSYIVNANAYEYVPLLRLLFKPAFYVWSLCLCILSSFYLKEKNKLVVYLFPLLYFMTHLLGPVVNFRYIYPIVATAPLCIAWLLSNKKWTDS